MLLAARDLRTSYGGTEVLRGISLTVAAGEVVCVIGPSGGGKSTLLRLLSGQEAPTSGAAPAAGAAGGDSRQAGAEEAPGAFVPRVVEQAGRVAGHLARLQVRR
ncbi:MAG: ATP-binding cassette domain-containing protein, partial [Opitutia bacterium]